MGERLKFSFGHVIAFISLMFIGYVTFMGAIYFSKADFEWALVAVLVEILVLFSLLMLLQKMKTVKHNFKRNIWIERAFVIFLILACGYAFTYFMKFWNVYVNKDLVSTSFTEATASADNMFVAYDDYCAQRITNHEQRLQNVFRLTATQLLYQVDDSVLCLKLQSPQYKELESDARKWIASTAQGVSVWNVFMMGNERKMSQVVDEWYGMLVSMSQGQLGTENNVEVFDVDHKNIEEVHEKIASLESLFSTDGFTLWSLIGLPAFFLLFLPYLIQDRYFRSTYILFCPHSARDQNGKLHTYWGRDKSWVERHVNNVLIDTDANTNKASKIVETLDKDTSEVKSQSIVTHMGTIEEGGKEKIVIQGIDNKENKTENIVVKGDVGSKHRRRRGQTFNYDVDEEIHAIVTQMNEK